MPEVPVAAKRSVENVQRLLQHGQALQAEQLIAGTLVLAPEHSGVIALFARIQRAMGCNADAALEISWLLQTQGDDLELLEILAAAQAGLGDHSSAELSLKRACALRPDADRRLKLGAKLDASGRHLDALRKLAIDPKRTADERMKIRFALGRAFEQAGEFAVAFEAFAWANQYMREQTPWSAELHHRLVDALDQAFARESISADAQASKCGKDVIFVVGLPRSGSTVVEPILSAHSQVEGCSELLDLALVRPGAGRRCLFVRCPGAYWNDYVPLTARWQHLHSRQFLVQQHESLLAEAGSQIRDLLEFLVLHSSQAA